MQFREEDRGRGRNTRFQPAHTWPPIAATVSILSIVNSSQGGMGRGAGE